MGTRRLEIAAHPAGLGAEVAFTFDGQSFWARRGETLAQALLAHGIYVLGRSSKYHRPRGLFCGIGSCGNCVARINGRPSGRLCLARPQVDLQVHSQNTLGTARFDALGVIDWLFFRGLDHHHLFTQATHLNRMAISVARQLAGIGRLPIGPAEAVQAAALPQVHVQVAVVGAGPAGRAAAAVCRRHCLQTWLLEASSASPPVSASAAPPESASAPLPASASASPSASGLASAFAPASAPEEDAVLPEHRVVGFYDDRELLVLRPDGLLRLRADAVVLAVGGYVLPPPCPGNDAPGVLSFRAVEAALALGIVPGWRVVVAAAEDVSARAQAVRCSEALRRVGVQVHTVGLGDEPEHLLRIAGCAPQLQVQTSRDQTTCEAVVWCGRPVPAYELPRHLGVDTVFDPTLGGFVPIHDNGVTACEGIFVAGEVAGVISTDAAAHGTHVGEAVAARLRYVDEGILV